MKTLNFKLQTSNSASRQVVGVILAVLVLMPVGFASARTPKLPAQYGAVDIDTLGVEEPAILASNPFYGLTGLMRDVKDSFASGRLDKAVIKLANMNLKAAQLLKIRAVAPDNLKSITKAQGEYRLALYQYTISLTSIKAGDFATEEGPETIDSFVSSSMVNLRFIDDLLATSQNNADQALFAEIFERLAQSTMKLFADTIGIETVKLHLLAGVSDEPLIGIREAEMISALAKQAVVLEYENAAQELMALRGELLDMLAEKLVAESEEAAPATRMMKVAGPSLMSAGVEEIAPVNIEQMSEFTILAGSSAERIQTLSYLLSTKQLEKSSDLIGLRNQLLIKVFSK